MKGRAVRPMGCSVSRRLPAATRCPVCGSQGGASARAGRPRAGPARRARGRRRRTWKRAGVAIRMPELGQRSDTTEGPICRSSSSPPPPPPPACAAAGAQVHPSGVACCTQGRRQRRSRRNVSGRARLICPPTGSHAHTMSAPAPGLPRAMRTGLPEMQGRVWCPAAPARRDARSWRLRARPAAGAGLPGAPHPRRPDPWPQAWVRALPYPTLALAPPTAPMPAAPAARPQRAPDRTWRRTRSSASTALSGGAISARTSALVRRRATCAPNPGPDPSQPPAGPAGRCPVSLPCRVMCLSARNHVRQTGFASHVAHVNSCRCVTRVCSSARRAAGGRGRPQRCRGQLRARAPRRAARLEHKAERAAVAGGELQHVAAVEGKRADGGRLVARAAAQLGVRLPAVGPVLHVVHAQVRAARPVHARAHRVAQQQARGLRARAARSQTRRQPPLLSS